ncbi:MAG: hypothetical protein ACQESG_05125 [Nanobdellota archaeon]
MHLTLTAEYDERKTNFYIEYKLSQHGEVFQNSGYATVTRYPATAIQKFPFFEAFTDIGIRSGDSLTEIIDFFPHRGYYQQIEGSGIGTELLNAILEESVQHDIHTVYAKTSYQEMPFFLEAKGFQELHSPHIPPYVRWFALRM